MPRVPDRRSEPWLGPAPPAPQLEPVEQAVLMPETTPALEADDLYHTLDGNGRGLEAARRGLLRLFHTSTFRLSLVYMGLFGASVLLLLGFIYWNTVSFITRQVDATIDAEIQGLAEQYRQRGLPGLIRIVAERSVAEREGPARRGGAIYLLLDPEMGHLAGNLDRWPSDDDPDVTYNGHWVSFHIAFEEKGEIQTHLARAATFGLQGDYRLLVGQDMHERMAFQTLITESLTWAVILTLALGVLGGIAMSRNMLRRVDAINRTARQIVQGDLSQRIVSREAGFKDSPDEFDRLTDNLNAMLDQIERLMAGMRAVTDNVAHDLRSPLTRMKSRLEVTLLAEHSPEGLRQALQETILEADAMLATFNALLSIARLESGAQHIQLRPVDLASLARDAAELYEPVFEDRELSFSLDLAPGLPPVAGDPHLLAQALANLLDNAAKYVTKGRVSIRLNRHRNGIALIVADEGPGIPPAYRSKVLGRYVRMEESRSTPGNGLGLSLVSAVAQLHNARLHLEATHLDGSGLSVWLLFPAQTLRQEREGRVAA